MEDVLIVAPDHEARWLTEVLAGCGLSAHSCVTVQRLLDRLQRGASCVMIAQEALDVHARTLLDRWRHGQPPWSDLPFLLLTDGPSGEDPRQADTLLDELGHASELARPLDPAAVRRAALSGLRARRRQYLARDALSRQRHAEAALRAALEAGDVGTWTLDAETGTLAMSSRCKAHHGLAPDAVAGLDEMLACVHEQDRDSLAKALRAAREGLSGGRVHEQYRCLRPDGDPRCVELRGSLTVPGDGPPILTGVSQDVTARRKDEEDFQRTRQHLRRLNETLESRVSARAKELAHANDRLMKEINERERTQAALLQAQKMEAVGHLTGGIAHDFNNLLHAVACSVDLIERVAADDRVKRLVTSARAAVERGARLTGQLLAFSRSQNLSLQPLDVSERVAGMSELLAASAGSGIHLHTELASNLPQACADRSQLELALLNLVLNARDALPEGGRIVVATRLAECEAGMVDLAPGRYVVLSVTDSGVGIPADVIGKVFDPFFTTKAVGKGTGLGLSQAYGIARQSGGTVRLASEVGKGTVAEIWLPVAESEDEATGERSPAPCEIRDPGTARVLVVDDDANVRQLIVECLEVIGYKVRQADSGARGLALLEEDPPDLLVVDFIMPGMNGAEVISRVRRTHPEIPIVLSTGYADARIESGIPPTEKVLQKPFDIDQLARTVSEALDRSAARRPDAPATSGDAPRVAPPGAS